MSQDGLSVASSAQWAKLLSPLAARALKNLSWKGSRTLRTPAARVLTGRNLDFTLEASDQYADWSRL